MAGLLLQAYVKNFINLNGLIPIVPVRQSATDGQLDGRCSKNNQRQNAASKRLSGGSMKTKAGSIFSMVYVVSPFARGRQKLEEFRPVATKVRHTAAAGINH
ncbi:MAG TPA: hypothetical protein VGK97_08780 [Spongiibacteraceae bacterium]|jgi:hypothetical protein